jgi:uncharacterized protein
MLRIGLGALRQGPLDVARAVPADDAVFEKLEFQLSEPVHLGGRLMDAGIGQYYWHGTLRTRVKAECRRCLTETEVEIDQQVEALFTEDQATDDPAAYVINPDAKELDLAEAVREELILAVPEYALCKDDCRGLCPRCGADLNAGPCTCTPETDRRWSMLQALRSELPDDEAD